MEEFLEWRIKSTQSEERLAYVLSRRGIQKFDKFTMAKGLPRGSVVYTDLASADNIRRYPTASAI